MKKPYGDGCLHADEQELGASLRPPDQHQLTVMNAPEKHGLDAGTKKRKKRDTGGNSAEEEQQEEDRQRKRMLQSDGGACANEAIGMINEDLALHRSQQGLGATVQFLHDTEDNWALDQQIETAAGTSHAPRNLAATSRCSINALPLDILNFILMKINSASIRSAVSSSFVFVRAVMSPCECDAFRENGSFIAAIVQPRYGRPSVAAPKRERHHPLSSAAIMLDKFISLRYTALRWHRIIDSRKGYLLIQRNQRADQFDVMRPTTRVVSLPLIDLRQQEVLITATIVPEPSPRFVVMMLFREGMDVTLREFRSRQGMWIQQRVRCSLTLGTLSESRRLPLYASDKLYLLDEQRLRVLCFSREQNLLDSVHLPESVEQAFVQASSLSRTREGQVCWVALNRLHIIIFALDGITWSRKRQWPVPEHFYRCRLIGFAEDSQQVTLECYGEVCCIDIEEGVKTYLKEGPAADSCVAFEIDHVAAEHE